MENGEGYSFPRPVVVCSRCMGFENCRFNGQMLHDSLVEALIPFVNFITPCPEKDMGLGVPRHPVRVVLSNEVKRLRQLVTDEDFTGSMENFCKGFFWELGEVDGFILKSRSPSCGIFDVKYYPEGEKKPPAGKGPGFFGEKVLHLFPGIPAEDEARLGNVKIRDHFLTKIFVLADLRGIRFPGELVSFQSRHKLLLMAYSQKEMRELGRIVAHQSETGIESALKSYRLHLLKALEKGPSYRSHVNVLEHAFGYVSKKLTGEERQFFLDSLEMFREDRTPLVTLLNLVQSWIIRFKVDYLKGQSYFMPYPVDLRREFDRYRNRDYWGR